jgi:membrane protease YdiL (CAAX protease family)
MFLNQTVRLAAGIVVLFATLQGTAAALGSTRGEWGLLVAALVITAAFGVQRLLHGEDLGAIGVRVERRGLFIAVVLSGAILVAGVAYAAIADAQAARYPNATWLALGILCQAGVAEELIFRGYLYGRLARTRPFWRAAMVSMWPFALVHMVLFVTLDWPLAMASLLLSIALSFPLAHLYELGGRAIWAPAIVHAVIQAGPKLIVTDDAAFPLIWMLFGLAIAWSSFLVRVQKT